MSDILSKIKELPLESKKKLKEIMPSLQSNVFDKLLMDQIDSMNDEEYNVFLELLFEAAEGSSKLHDDLVMEDYDELPVDISTFITDPEYLGASTGNGDNIYPYWKSTLTKLFTDSSVVEIILSGAIGIGKSTVALIALAYILHRLLCLKNPAKHYNLLEGSKIAIALFNISLDQVYGIGYGKLQSLLKLSPWFLRNGTLSGRNAGKVTALLAEGRDVPSSLVADLTYYPNKDIHIIVGSQESHFTGYDVFAGMIDEMNFYTRGGKSSDPSKFMESGIMKVYTSIKRRMESRYMMMGKVPGILVLISSKKSEHDALELYANKVRNNKNVLVVDEPQWVVKNTPGRYSGKTFKLIVGDKYHKTQILSQDEDWKSYESEGRKVLDVPIEHYEAFVLDPDKALTDIAGISLVSGNKFINANKYRECIDENRRNAFSQDIVEMGMNNGNTLQPYFRLNDIPQESRVRPHYIHWDASKTGDRTGLGIIAPIREFIEVSRIEDGEVVKVNDRRYELVGSVGIQAPAGDEIPFRRIFEFILWLRTNGFKIAQVTMDSYQSVSVLQDFNDHGIKALTVSLDRKPDGYNILRSTIYEKRLSIYESPILEKEVTELIQNNQTMKVDHPSDGSKDISDGVTGALYGATTNSAEPTSVDIISRANEAILNELANDSKNDSVNNAPNKSALDQQLFSSLSDMLDEFF